MKQLILYNKDGSSSYCAVAQAGVLPEKLAEKFDIPHYFLIQMKFLKADK